MDLALPADSLLRRRFDRLVEEQSIVFLAGLPGAGKSLLLRELALLAEAAGRRVHLLQWDVTRAAFETPDVLARYPEVDGVTHAAIRKGVGLWAREAVRAWHARYAAAGDLLVGETPLIGNRLVELVRPWPDEAEAILSAQATLFVVPVPSREVRAVIEAARDASSAAPAHDLESRDARPDVLQSLWREVAALGERVGLRLDGPAVYHPGLYAAVYAHLLRHRRHEILPVDIVLTPPGSAHTLRVSGEALAATPTAVAASLARVARDFTPQALADDVDRWFDG